MCTDYRNLYASHKAIVDKVLQTYPASMDGSSSAIASSTSNGLASGDAVGAPSAVPLVRQQTSASWAGNNLGGAPSASFAVGAAVWGDVDSDTSMSLYDNSPAARKLLSARFQLNSLGGASNLAGLGNTPYWRSIAMGTSMASVDERRKEPENAPLTTIDMHDIFDISRPQVFGIITVLEKLQVAERAGGSSLVEKTIRTIAKSLVMDDALFEANIYENLHSLLPWSQRIPQLRALVKQLSARHETWAHDDSGRIDTAPLVPQSELSEVPASALADLRRLAFVQLPPDMLDPTTLAERTREVWSEVSAPSPSRALSRGAMPPTALVTVGCPGSGKSYVTKAACLPHLAKLGLGPSIESYLTIDPDFWLSNVCQNDNACRPLVNWLNHENFLRAVGLKQHLIFDGTGKSLLNTCGRIVSRMKRQVSSSTTNTQEDHQQASHLLHSLSLYHTGVSRALVHCAGELRLVHGEHQGALREDGEERAGEVRQGQLLDAQPRVQGLCGQAERDLRERAAVRQQREAGRADGDGERREGCGGGDGAG